MKLAILKSSLPISTGQSRMIPNIFMSVNDMGLHPIIIVGDFNETLDLVLDKSYKTTNTYQVLHTYMVDLGWFRQDVRRLGNPIAKDYTVLFFSSAHPTNSILDYFLVAQDD